MPPTDADIKAWQAVVGAPVDAGKAVFGPKTIAATIAWARSAGHLPPPLITADARARVVAIAAAELGEQLPHKYYADAAPIYMTTKPNEKSWCGVFALWCLRKAGLTRILWKDGVGFLYPMGLPGVSIPEPGDIAYFNMPFQHHAIVREVKNGWVYTYDGNTMRGTPQAPKEGVTEKRYRLTDGRYYSIRNLVAAAP